MAVTDILGRRNDLATGDTLPASEYDALVNDAEWLAGGHLAYDGAGTGSSTLSETQYETNVIVVTGVLTGARTLVLPLHAGRRWWVYNNTSGAFSLTIQASTGTGIVVTQGYVSLLECDGTNFVRLGVEVSGALDGSIRTVSPRIVTGINDTNGNELLKVTATASAVNEATLANAAAGNRPVLSATGDDTNISLELRGKGTGGVAIGSGGTPVLKQLSASTTWDPGSIADGDDLSTTLTVAGAAVGDPCHASLSTLGTNDVLISAHVQAANTVRVVLLNRTGGSLDLGSGTLRAVVLQF